jgi:hypothetical protein
MRHAGVYKDLARDGGRWELKQALRWALLGQIFKDEQWCQTEFGGFGFCGGSSDRVLCALLTRYAPMHWPEHGKLGFYMRAQVKNERISESFALQLKCSSP